MQLATGHGWNGPSKGWYPESNTKGGKEPYNLAQRSCHISLLPIRHHHEQVEHQGHHLTKGAVRAEGQWILGGKMLINSVLRKFITCRKLRGKLKEQHMADLSPERLKTCPPFTCICGAWCLWALVHYFQTHQRRTSREQAVGHYVQLSKFQSCPHWIDRVKGCIQLHKRSQTLLRTQRPCKEPSIWLWYQICWSLQGAGDGQNVAEVPQWTVNWDFNPPHASHMGGSWEHMIGVAGRILDSVFLQQKTCLTHEVVCTLMAEVTAILNAIHSYLCLQTWNSLSFSRQFNRQCSSHRSQEFHLLLETLLIRTFMQNNGEKCRHWLTSFGPVGAENLCNKGKGGWYLAETFKLEISFSWGTNRPLVTAGPWPWTLQHSLARMVMSRGVPIRFFFYLDPDLSLSIFSICRYRVPIRYLALTNIFLDNTAAFRNKVPASKLFLSRFFLFCWNQVYTFIWLFLILHMLLQHWPTTFLVLAGESVTLHCDSRPLCAAAEVCETQLTLGASISCIAFYKFLTLSREITLLVYFTRGQHLLDCLFYMLCCMRPTKLVRIPARCNSKVESI